MAVSYSRHRFGNRHHTPERYPHMSSLHNRHPYFHHVFITAFLCVLSCHTVCADFPTSPTLSWPAASTLDSKVYEGKNLLLFFYSIDDSRVVEAVGLIKELYAIRNDYNFDLAGIALPPDRLEELQQFNQNQGIPFPVYLDYDRQLSAKFKLAGGVGLYIYNRQGQLIGSRMGNVIPRENSLADNWRAYATEYLRIPYLPADEPILGIKPPVPLFKGNTIGGSIIDIKEVYQAGPVIILFFSPGCSHCQDELAFLNSLYNAGELQGKFEIVAVSVSNQEFTADFISSQNYLFPVMVDAGRKITSLFPSYTGTIPISFLVDRTGSIVSMHKGFNDHMRTIYMMELKKLAGLPNPPLLSKKGYSGESACVICHEQEHIQWKLTRHADAFASMVRKGTEDDETCVSCHVTGYGEAGGYSLSSKRYSKHLEGVQCEACHGPGHESCSAFAGEKAKTKKAAEWKKRCLACHTEKESINFVFAKRYPRILHGNAPDLTKMTREERLRFLLSYREKSNIFDNPARYVGAESCRGCHSREYEHWNKTAHAATHTTEKAKTAPPEKQYRYNTGAGSAGGYPEPGREGVQCEACHGPGENHVAEPEAKGQGYIVGLTRECSSCVVEQICRRCHSSEDDPDFDFQKQLLKVRHGSRVSPEVSAANEHSVSNR